MKNKRGEKALRQRICWLLLGVLASILLGCTNMDSPDSLDSGNTTVEELDETDHFQDGALEHILEGELNRQGQAVGFHYEGFSSSKGEVISDTRTAADKNGVYEAEVVVEDVEKQSNQGKSSFFPEEWTSQEVVVAINEAYENRKNLTGNTYAGLSEDGIVIQMYLNEEEQIISAFPEYEGE